MTAPALRLLAFVVALATLAGTAARPARGEDEDETAKRLKAAGVSDELREQVRKSIDKAVQFLVKRQRTDGSFAESFSAEEAKDFKSHAVGVTLLCAHALQHAGTAATRPAIARALDWVFPAKGAERTELGETYTASLALMVLASVDGRAAEARQIAKRLIALQNTGSGWWSYGRWDDTKPDPQEGDLSNSQFAVLGLRAAMKKDIAVPDAVWARHAAALCKHQSRAGSWPYDLRPPRALTKGGAPIDIPASLTETAMGMANLWVAKALLEQSNAMPKALAPKVEAALTLGRATLEREGSEMLGLLDPKISASVNLSGPVGWGVYYDLFSLEKACVFGDVRTKGGAPWPWYAAGAKYLVDIQHADGCWDPWENPKKGRGSEVETALALLFLEQSVSVFRVTTVSGDAPPAPSKDPKPDDPSSPTGK